MLDYYPFEDHSLRLEASQKNFNLKLDLMILIYNILRFCYFICLLVILY